MTKPNLFMVDGCIGSWQQLASISAPARKPLFLVASQSFEMVMLCDLNDAGEFVCIQGPHNVDEIDALSFQVIHGRKVSSVYTARMLAMAAILRTAVLKSINQYNDCQKKEG